MFQKPYTKTINKTIEDDFFYDLEVVSISTQLPIYTFLHYIEQQLLFSFNLSINKSKTIPFFDKIYFFETYEYYDHLRHFEYYIYTNKIEDNFLLPELKWVKFLWGIKGFGNVEKEKYIENLMDMLREIGSVTYVEKTKNEHIRNKALLLF